MEPTSLSSFEIILFSSASWGLWVLVLNWLVGLSDEWSTSFLSLVLKDFCFEFDGISLSFHYFELRVPSTCMS